MISGGPNGNKAKGIRNLDETTVFEFTNKCVPF